MVRNVLAIIIGIIVGSIVNMGLVVVGSSLIPAPEGIDVTNLESVKAGAHLFQVKHFIFPFLAHAVGTLAGAFAASLIGVSSRMILAFIIGGFFLIGGIAAAFMIPAPFWFIALDLIVAYLPMAWLGYQLSGKKL